MTSPIIQTNSENYYPEEMTLPKALEHVIDGKKITRVSWNDKREYGFFNQQEGFLEIHKAGTDKTHAWIINDGDLLAIDWIVL